MRHTPSKDKNAFISQVLRGDNKPGRLDDRGDGRQGGVAVGQVRRRGEVVDLGGAAARTNHISPNAKPPVCKILDYGKYRYELQKKEKEARKKQKTIQVKEIRLSTFIEEHDLIVKANNASKFLKDGDKVKVSLRFKGREKDHAGKGQSVMARFAEVTGEYGVIEKKPEFEGRSLIMVLAPKTDK